MFEDQLNFTILLSSVAFIVGALISRIFFAGRSGSRRTPSESESNTTLDLRANQEPPELLRSQFFSSFLSQLAIARATGEALKNDSFKNWLAKQIVQTLSRYLKSIRIVLVLHDKDQNTCISAAPLVEALEKIIVRQVREHKADKLTIIDCAADRGLVGQLGSHGLRFILQLRTGSLGFWCGYPGQAPLDNPEVEKFKICAGAATELFASLSRLGVEIDQRRSLKSEQQELKLAVSQVAHDVRSGLASFIHSLGFLQQKPDLQCDFESKRLLDLARSNAAAASALLDGFVEVASSKNLSSDGNSANLSDQPPESLLLQQPSSDVLKVTREVADLFLLRAQEKNIELVVQLPGTQVRAKADANDLRRILLNLVGNAVKFTDCGAVRVEVIADQSTSFRVVVVDTGPGLVGITEKELFEPHSRGISDKPGEGLGLSVAHSLTLKNSGKLSVYSSAQRGTRFELSLPRVSGLQVAFDRSIQEANQDFVDLKSPQILLVDDDRECAESLQRVLKSKGILADLSFTVDDALSRVVASTTVLTDLDMPGGGGQRLIRELRRKFPLLKVGVISGTDDELLAYEALGLGAEIIFRKPADAEALITWVNRDLPKVCEVIN